MSALIDYSGLCYIWQLKWYRWDRFRDFLATEQGKKFLRRYDLFYRTFVAIIIFLWPINDKEKLKYIIISFFITDLCVITYRFIKKKTRYPHISIKAISIIFASMAIEASWLLITKDWNVLILALILRFFIIMSSIFLFNKITKIIKYLYIFLATQKMKKYPHLKVIGITGSYAKTTVKNFLAEILSSKYKVVKTPKNINSHFGILRFILSTNFRDKDVFIVEIGADQKGDVNLICNIIKPTIGILTAVNEQHLATFGSIKNTQSAKYELLRSLPAEGLAITNSDNPYCREYLHELKTHIATFGTEEEYNPTLLITDIKTIREKGVYCKTRITWNDQTEERDVQTHLQGEHNIYNLAPCTLACLFLGMRRDEIIEADTRITQPTNALHTYMYGSSTIIDDSYNSNPDGFKAALHLLNSYPSEKKRIVITRGMIELSDRSKDIHEQIAGEISFIADELIITTLDFVEPLKRGAVASKYNLMIRVETDPQQLLKYIISLKNTDSVILIENRIPEFIKKELKKET